MEYGKNRITIESILVGLAAMSLMAAFYYLVLYYFTKDANHPLEEIRRNRFWVSALVLGFGIQAGLYWNMKRVSCAMTAKSKTAVAAGTGISTASMIACCAHHLADLAPFLGLAAASIYLSEYQTELFLLGIVANAAGIWTILKARKINMDNNRIK